MLSRDDVTIYQAAFEAQGLFVRVDILRKRGSVIELIEVKAEGESYNPVKGGDFRNRDGGVEPDLHAPASEDIAFQRHVAGLCVSAVRVPVAS